MHFLLENISDSPNPTFWESREVRENTPMLDFTFDGRPTILLGNNLSKLENQMTIYPNPVRNSISIEHGLSKIEIKNIKIISVFGQVLLEKNSRFQRTEIIDLSQYKDGLYLVSITMKNGTSVSKKIIKR